MLNLLFPRKVLKKFIWTKVKPLCFNLDLIHNLVWMVSNNLKLRLKMKCLRKNRKRWRILKRKDRFLKCINNTNIWYSRKIKRVLTILILTYERWLTNMILRLKMPTWQYKLLQKSLKLRWEWISLSLFIKLDWIRISKFKKSNQLINLIKKIMF